MPPPPYRLQRSQTTPGRSHLYVYTSATKVPDRQTHTEYPVSHRIGRTASPIPYRNSNSYYLSSNFNDSSSLLISHNIYSLGNKIMNEVSASVNNHLIGQTIEISYNISTGNLTSFVIENNKKVELSNEEAREKLLQILKISTTYAKTIILDNLVDNGYSKTLNCSER